jgi:hypothetical protein
MQEEQPSSPQQEEKTYSPREAAEILGVSVRTLAYIRQTGRIEGKFIGYTTVYTEEQIQKADLSKERPGRKPGQRDDKRGQKKRRYEGADEDNASLPPQWHISDNKAHSRLTTRRLVGVS